MVLYITQMTEKKVNLFKDKNKSIKRDKHLLFILKRYSHVP